MIGSIEINKEIVANAAEKRINQILNLREKAKATAEKYREDFLRQWHEKNNKKWFKSKASDKDVLPTVEEVIVIDSSDKFNDMYYISELPYKYVSEVRSCVYSGETTIQKCKSLLALAKNSIDGKVILTDEGVKILGL